MSDPECLALATFGQAPAVNHCGEERAWRFSLEGAAPEASCAHRGPGWKD